MQPGRGLGWTMLLAVAVFVLGFLALQSGFASRSGWFPSREQLLSGEPAIPETQMVLVPGSPEKVRKAIWEVVAAEKNAPDPTENLEAWTDVIQTHVWVQPQPAHVIVVPGEGRIPAESRRRLAWALPGAYWGIQAGYPVVFAGQDGLDPEAEAVIRRYRVPVYVAAPEILVSRRVMDRIRLWTPAVRIGADELRQHAAVIAEYRRRYRGFSWLMGPKVREEWVVAAASDSGQVLAALPMARSHAAGLLYLAEDGRLPPAVEASVQSGNWLERSGRQHRFWLVGKQSRPKVAGLLEETITRGRPGSGRGFRDWAEAVVAVMFGLSLLSAAGTLLGRWQASAGLRVGWALAAFFAPVAALRLGFRSRPPRTVLAHFGFIASLILGTAFALAVPTDSVRLPDAGWQFLLGTGVSLILAAVWSALLLGMAAGRRSRVAPTLRSLALCVLAVGLGLMTLGVAVQWLQPPLLVTQNSVIRLGALWAAGVFGFAIVWVVNDPIPGARPRRLAAAGSRAVTEGLWPKQKEPAIRP